VILWVLSGLATERGDLDLGGYVQREMSGHLTILLRQKKMALMEEEWRESTFYEG